ncbi:unnamed protein product [Prorocentrum cordatum]|uniref:Uncharacterized protein n=1 Tax=Prorocentrum cordatum TaxID=2364126 RepID=A0ABN9RSK0_9DINO|nr:unnamed protein product [Polarella glacialis]
MAARGGDGRAPAPALAGEAEAPGGPGHGAAPSPAERQPHTFDIATPERVAAPAAAAAAGAAGRPGPAWRVAALEPGGSSRPSPPRGIIEKRKDGFRREWEQQHPFWPSLEKGGRPHSQRGRAPPKAPPPQQAGATRNMRLHADWKYSAEGRRKKIAESEVDKVGQVVEDSVSSSRALSEERALAHLRKNRRMLQERGSRGAIWSSGTTTWGPTPTPSGRPRRSPARG